MTSFVALTDPPAEPSGPSRWYVVRQAELLTTPEGEIPVADRAADLGVQPDGPAVFLGVDGDVGCWAVGVAADAEAPEPLWWQPLLSLGMSWGTVEWMLGGRAVQLVEWSRTSRFCGRCGTPTEETPGERARHCPACGLAAYPRLAPAIIVLVHRGEEVLLAQGRGFRGGMRSALAGFVEPGEDLEEAVRREVFEEVGVTLGAVSYVGSQPWPFPHSLMIAFDAEWMDGEITPDGMEILSAAWYPRHALPPIPPSMSIARTLIDRWLKEGDGSDGPPTG